MSRLSVRFPLLLLAASLAVPAATFTVNSTADSSVASCAAGSTLCTLRAAIQAPSLAPGASTTTVPAGAYLLSQSTPCAIRTNGDTQTRSVSIVALCLTGQVTITGAGAGVTIIDSQQLDRVMVVTATVAQVSGVTPAIQALASDPPQNTVAGGAPVDLAAPAFSSVAPVPGPRSILLLGFVLIVIALCRRRVSGNSVCGALFCFAILAAGKAEAQGLSAANSNSKVSADELKKAQTFVDARYKASDVRHTFKTRFGDTIDCIDFLAQPGVKEMERRGTPVTALPQLKQTTPKTNAVFDGLPDENGSARQCPANTVAQVKLTPDQIARTGGLDTYLSRIRKHALGGKNQKSAPPPEFGLLGYAHTYYSYIGGNTLTQAQASLSIWNPSVPAFPNHSLQQVWWTSGGNNFVPGTPAVPCAPTCQQTVEAGWTVDPGLNLDGKAHLFIFSTVDGYQNGCYNGVIPAGGAGSVCAPWISLPSAYPPGLTLPSSGPGSPPTLEELQVWIGPCSVFQECPAGWEVRIRVGGVGNDCCVAIGYFPAADYTGAFQTGATVFKAGGEVFDGSAQASKDSTWTSPLIPMGSGRVPTAGLGNAAYVANVSASGPGGAATSFDGKSFDQGASTVPSKYATWQDPSGSNLDYGIAMYLGLTPPAPAPLPAPVPVCSTPGIASPADRFSLSGGTPMNVTANGSASTANLLLSGPWVAGDGGANATGQIVSSNLPAGSAYYTSLGASEFQNSYGVMQLGVIPPVSTNPGSYSVTVQAMDTASCVTAATVIPIRVLACVPQTACPSGAVQICGRVSNGCGGVIDCGSCGTGTCSDGVCCPANTSYNANDGACEPASCPTGTTFCADLGICTTDAKCNKRRCPGHQCQ